MKVKTATLIGPALDWAVATALGVTEFGPPPGRSQAAEFALMHDDDPALQFSTNWSQGGPIIEREWLDITPWPNESDENQRWQVMQFDRTEVVEAFGPTPLIAGMRCFIASRLGDEVEVPQELT